MAQARGFLECGPGLRLSRGRTGASAAVQPGVGSEAWADMTLVVPGSLVLLEQFGYFHLLELLEVAGADSGQ